MDHLSSVSVVIPTFNRSEQLRRVLPSYLASSCVREVIIVDDAGTDDTGDQIRLLSEQEPRLHYMRNARNLGLPASRNRGASEAAGSWILQSEDDLALGKGCVETLLEHAQHSGADIISGRRIWMRLGETESLALSRATNGRHRLFNEWLLDIDSHTVVPEDTEVPLLSATMLIRRSVMAEVEHNAAYGGPSSWREESDFQISALEKGFRLVFCPHAVTFHYSRASQSFGRNRLKGTAVYAYRVYHNDLMFLRRHRSYLREHYPRSVLLGSPTASALLYGIYRGGWLFLAEVIRAWRAKKYGAFSWH
jgi:GT2 family glycosyltransferase